LKYPQNGMTSETAASNPALLEELHDLFRSSLLGYARTLVRDSFAAEDLVQETFFRAVKHQGEFAGYGLYQKRAWLYRVLKNVFLDDLRHNSRENRYVEQEGHDSAARVSHPIGVGFSEWLEGMTEKEQELLHQHFVLRMSSDEIGAELHIPAATVRARLHLAIKKLRKQQEGNLER
jgi:RNA polymerase sigma-70 factor (ECF subfamily)